MWTISNPALTMWVQVAVGLLLLCFGRRLFWVFVGAFGFLAGVQIAAQVARAQPEWLLLLIAAGLGIVGAVLAIVLQRVAVAVAGWFAGGWLAIRLVLALGWQADSTLWIAFIVGAVLAAVLVSLLFDWALIVLSALTGAILVSNALPWGQPAGAIAAAVLFALGALMQARGLERPAQLALARKAVSRKLRQHRSDEDLHERTYRAISPVNNANAWSSE